MCWADLHSVATIGSADAMDILLLVQKDAHALLCPRQEVLVQRPLAAKHSRRPMPRRPDSTLNVAGSGAT